MDAPDASKRRASFRLSFKSPRSSRSSSSTGALSPPRASSPPASVAPTLNLPLQPLSPKEQRHGSLLSGRSGSMSGRSGSVSGRLSFSSQRSGSVSGRSMTSLQSSHEEVEHKHLAVLMAGQTAMPDLHVPVFLTSIGRFIRDHAHETGMLEEPTPVELQHVDRILKEVSVGREYHFRAVSLGVVYRVLLRFLSGIPTPPVISFEVRPLMRQLLHACVNGSPSLQNMAEFFEMLPSLSRCVLLELLHICGMLAENSIMNGCHPLYACAAVGQIAFAEQYVMVDDDAIDERVVGSRGSLRVDWSLEPQDSGQGRLLLAMVKARRDLMCLLQAPPPLGQSNHELLACISQLLQFEKEKVTGIAFASDGSCCIVGSRGSICVRDASFFQLQSAKTAQPLFFVESVSKPPSWWLRGEMYAEIRSAQSGMPRTLKLSRNARSFLFIPELDRVWGGSEGLIHVFDASTGAEMGSSISFAPASAASASPRPPEQKSGTPSPRMLWRQESAMVDESEIDLMVKSLDMDMSSLREVPNLALLASSMTLAPSPISASRGAARHVAVRMLVRSQRHIWAAGGTLLKVFPLVDPPPPSALATTEEESEFTGLAVISQGGSDEEDTVVIATLASGLLVKYSLDGSFSFKRDELKTSMPTLKHLTFLSDNMLISTSGKHLHMFHLGFWKHIGSIGVNSPVSALASAPFNDDRWQLVAGHEDGTVRRWTVSRQGFESAAATMWKRPTASEAIISPFVDARTGATIMPEEVEVDRSKALFSEMFGVTYRGKFRSMDVAVKELSAESFTADEMASFQRHLETPKVPHERWCSLLAYSITDNKRAVLITRGYRCTLYELLKKGKMRQRLRMQIADQVARYLAFLHSLEPPMLHLDITTSSIVLDQDLRVLVDDLYSLGRIRNMYSDPKSAKMYKSQRVLPPEMLQSTPVEKLTPAADVYQFGMLVWSLLQQENPFHEVADIADLIERVCDKGERPPTPTKCPESMIRVLDACCQADPAKRPTMEALLSQDVFTRAYLEHSLNDKSAYDFWTNHVCKAHTSNLSEPVSLTVVIHEIMITCHVDQKTAVLLEEMFKNFLVHQNMVHVSDFGEMLQRFGPMSMTTSWADQLISQLVAPGMYGSISLDAAEDVLNKSKRGDYLLRFTRKEKGAFQLHVRGSESVRSYLIVPVEGGLWKLKESTSNQFRSLADLIQYYSAQFNLKHPLDNGVFEQIFNRVTGVEKKKRLFAKKEELTSTPGSHYATSFDLDD